MKTFTIFALTLALVIPVTKANEDLYLKTSRLDGLPHRLLESRLLAKDIASSEGSIDLSPVFREMGCNVPEGGCILYSSGTLVRKLNEESHKRVEWFIECLYHTDNLIATYRAYYNYLAPLTAAERFRTVIHIGFLPDPLIASALDDIRAIHSRTIDNEVTHDKEDPFAKSTPQPRPPTEEEAVQLKRLENMTTALLEIAMQRLKDQLAAIDAHAEPAGSAQPATKPADKVPVKDQPSTPTSKDVPR